MALNSKKKTQIVNKMQKIANLVSSAILVNPKGVKVNQINQLRKNSRENNIQINIVKNTLLKISLKKTPLEGLIKKISGSTLIAYLIQDPEKAIKLFTKFSKKNKNFKIISAAVNGKILLEKEIETLANLPSYKEAIIKFIIIIKTATIGKLFFILKNIKEKKINKKK